MNAEQIIPPITDPLGRCWKQPHRKYIEIDKTHALMSRQTFNGLKEYSCTLPTGAYEGKMWKSKINDTWFLSWYGKDENPDYVSIHRREILVV